MSKKFKAKVAEGISAEHLRVWDIPTDSEGYVEGYLTGDYIVGDIIEANDEYISHEWWCPIQPDTVKPVEEFPKLSDIKAILNPHDVFEVTINGVLEVDYQDLIELDELVERFGGCYVQEISYDILACDYGFVTIELYTNYPPVKGDE